MTALTLPAFTFPLPASLRHFFVPSTAAAPRAAGGVRTIAKGASAWLDARAGLEVSCTAGTLWLTYDGQQRDIVLAAGESHRCDGPGRLCVHAIEAGAMRLG